MTILTGNANVALGESTRPNRLAKGVPASISGERRGIDYPWFNTGDFEAVPRCVSTTDCSPSPHGFDPFTPGNSARNILYAPGRRYANLSLMKNFRLRERHRIQVRWEAFNALNTPNFRVPNKNFDQRGGGIITGVFAAGSGGPRVMQFALKYEF